MHATTVAVDLAKSVFQIAITDDKWKVIEQQKARDELSSRQTQRALSAPGISPYAKRHLIVRRRCINNNDLHPRTQQGRAWGDIAAGCNVTAQAKRLI